MKWVHHDTSPCHRARRSDGGALTDPRASHGQEGRVPARGDTLRRRGRAGLQVHRSLPRHGPRMVQEVGARRDGHGHLRGLCTARGRAGHLLRAFGAGHRRRGLFVLRRVPARARRQHQLLHHHDGVYPVGATAGACGRRRAAVHRLGARLHRVVPAHRALRLLRRGRVLPHPDPHILRRPDAACWPGCGLRADRHDAPAGHPRRRYLGRQPRHRRSRAAHRVLRVYQGRAVPLPLLAARGHGRCHPGLRVPARRGGGQGRHLPAGAFFHHLLGRRRVELPAGHRRPVHGADVRAVRHH